MEERMTREQVLNMLNDLVAEVGANYAYPLESNCMYFTQDIAPMCIVGHVFDRVLSEHDKRKVYNEKNHTTASQVWKHIDTYFTPEAQGLLEDAQWSQDNGLPWSESVALAAGFEEQMSLLPANRR